ncbi:hypothetical protein EII28_01740 [Fusobacterium nucleatum]|uniref:Conjugal transfer protein TraD n=1 Tax=Fusobacterium nucleatum TaxID=851 RepID=A0A3P1VVJ5_FUSNU|nr:hypothetical protein [Fusobacterium nucleatum]RRD38371.1 hypothetical protein EII28_01740 [Fusobacterium nucleatum]
MGSLEKINNKIHKLKYNISLFKSRKKAQEKSESKKKRIERARKLLRLGILFEMTSTDIYSIELIIGYLLELKEKKIYEIGALKYYGNKLLTENSIEKHDQKEVIFLDTKEKKKRNHKLISLGALFEITLTDNFYIAVLISYLENLHSLKEKDFIFYQENGENYLKNRRRKNGE